MFRIGGEPQKDVTQPSFKMSPSCYSLIQKPLPYREAFKDPAFVLFFASVEPENLTSHLNLGTLYLAAGPPS